MTDVGEIVLEYNFFECPVCLEIFDDTCKMLPCQHTFHKRCLQKILSVEERLECPQCRKLVSEDIELLPRNYFLLSVLDKAKPKPLESDQESLQLQFVIEKSKTESEVKAREEYLLLQKEKLEQELMLLKSEKKGCVTDDESKSQNSSTSSVCGYTSEGGAKENECAGAAAALLFEEFGSIQICDNSLELLKTKESLGHDVCCAMSLVQQVTEGFQTLNMFEAHADLVKKLLEIVKSVDSGKNFDGIELMHLIDYDDLIESYLKILTDQLDRENNSTASSQPIAAARSTVIPTPNCDAAVYANVSVPPLYENVHSYSVGQNTVPSEEVFVDLSDNDSDTGARSVVSAVNPCLNNDYQSYTFDDDDRNLNYAIELSRQLMAGNESDDVMEEVLMKSKITGTIDQQKQIFLRIREKVELQIALLMSKI